jgi:hypothetical protein
MRYEGGKWREEERRERRGETKIRRNPDPEIARRKNLNRGGEEGEEEGERTGRGSLGS